MLRGYYFSLLLLFSLSIGSNYLSCSFLLTFCVCVCLAELGRRLQNLGGAGASPGQRSGGGQPRGVLSSSMTKSFLFLRQPRGGVLESIVNMYARHPRHKVSLLFRHFFADRWVFSVVIVVVVLFCFCFAFSLLSYFEVHIIHMICTFYFLINRALAFFLSVFYNTTFFSGILPRRELRGAWPRPRKAEGLHPADTLLEVCMVLYDMTDKTTVVFQVLHLCGWWLGGIN